MLNISSNRHLTMRHLVLDGTAQIDVHSCALLHQNTIICQLCVQLPGCLPQGGHSQTELNIEVDLGLSEQYEDEL
jgi:Asp-tRNA(Asn)/Glu-tRNA(Gln) amidotransferase B subunit